MGQIRMHFGSVSEAAEQLQRQADAADEVLAELRGQVRDAVAVWEGAASEGFRATYRQWDDVAADLHKRLREIRGIAVTAHNNHAAAVTTNVAIWPV